MTIMQGHIPLQGIFSLEEVEEFVQRNMGQTVSLRDELASGTIGQAKIVGIERHSTAPGLYELQLKVEIEADIDLGKRK